MNNKMPKIAMGAWSWGIGAAGGDQVFGNHLFEEDLSLSLAGQWSWG